MKLNKDGHLFGAFIFNIVYWIIATDNSIVGFLTSCIFACVGGMLPDILEPATWPGRRSVFHYVVGPISIIPAIVFVNSNMLYFIGGAFCFGYFSHFILDIM
ncbi:MAG: hypothetical protein ACOWW1_00340 [archaeon]